MIKEQLLSIDKFSMPAVIEDQYAKAVMIIRLLLIYPGLLQNTPEAGVGLVEKWRYCDKEKLPELERVIQRQIIEFLPDIALSEVKVFYRNTVLFIYINTDTETIVLGTEDFKEISIYDIINNK